MNVYLITSKKNLKLSLKLKQNLLKMKRQIIDMLFVFLARKYILFPFFFFFLILIILFIILLYTFMKHKWGTNKQLIRGYTFDAGRTYKKLNHFRGGGSSVLSDLCFLYRGAHLFHKCGRKF